MCMCVGVLTRGGGVGGGVRSDAVVFLSEVCNVSISLVQTVTLNVHIILGLVEHSRNNNMFPSSSVQLQRREGQMMM